MSKIGIIIFAITTFLITDIYYDGKYSKLIKSWKKYYQMTFIAFLGLSTYLFIKKHPNHSKSLFVHANELIKYMPIDKNTSDILTPFLDITNNSTFSKELFSNNYQNKNNIQNKILNSGKNNTKRSVSETKKKFVASMQNWKCGKCNKQLTAWFEVDHKIRLDRGGNNEVNNLIALCRECHGEKTTMENL